MNKQQFQVGDTSVSDCDASEVASPGFGGGSTKNLKLYVKTETISKPMEADISDELDLDQVRSKGSVV